jgi:hypothetical protein
MIGNYHKWHAGQLWNTIDERSMDPKNLPKKWANPVHPLYQISRPFNALLDRSRAHQLDRMDRRASRGSSPTGRANPFINAEFDTSGMFYST